MIIIASAAENDAIDVDEDEDGDGRLVILTGDEACEDALDVREDDDDVKFRIDMVSTGELGPAVEGAVCETAAGCPNWITSGNSAVSVWDKIGEQ
ncbi:hypothetical protein BGZ54_004165 [Gamsiella multidivaricata]|nr:hypothetical protein BGZ54_004165 [Gamsiella multidivaricata]